MADLVRAKKELVKRITAENIEHIETVQKHADLQNEFLSKLEAPRNEIRDLKTFSKPSVQSELT